MNNISITALILAGGEAQRMGGVDKGLQLFGGESMIQSMARLAHHFAEDIIISANRNITEYQKVTPCVLQDIEPWQGVGPLGGFFAALDTIDTSHLLVLPCDTPKVSNSALEALVKQARLEPKYVHMIETESGWQPLHALLPVAKLKEHLECYLNETEHYGVIGLYKRIGFDTLIWDESSEFSNINYLVELEE